MKPQGDKKSSREAETESSTFIPAPPSALFQKTEEYQDASAQGEASTKPMADKNIDLPVGMELSSKYTYEIGKPLGRGGFGSVYLAKCLSHDPEDDDSPPEQVAIKVYHAPQDSDSTKLLKRELAALLALRNDRIPRVYDWSISGPYAFTVMDYFPKGSLTDLRSLMGNMPSEMAWRLLADLMAALNAAHVASLLHLDIKPGNVLIDDHGGFVLTDFGISQGSMVSWNIVDPGIGTRGYHAPEQPKLHEELIDVRTDLWGVGATVWSMFTGLELSDSKNKPKLWPEDPELGLPPMTKFRPDCPSELNNIVMSLLHVDRTDRPSCAAEVLQRMVQLSGEVPIDSETISAAVGMPISDSERAQMVSGLIDPLWASVCRTRGFHRFLVRFEDGQHLCHQGEKSYSTYLLLKGRVKITRNDEVIANESREGVFLGEISTLTGTERTASMLADGPVWACVFNLPDLEKLVTCNPAVGLRMIKSLAQRIAEDRLRTS